jgi:hypothetical protein
MYRAHERDTSQYLAPALYDADARVRRIAVIGLTISRKHGPLSAMDDTRLVSAFVEMMTSAPTEQGRLDAANYLLGLVEFIPDVQLQDRIRREVSHFEANREAQTPED